MFGLIKRLAGPVARIAGFGGIGAVVGGVGDAGVANEDPIMMAVLALATAIVQLIREVKKAKAQ